MATAILIRPDGSVCEITSKARKFSLEELQALVQGYIEHVQVVEDGKRMDLIVNEEGQLQGLPLNQTASMVALRVIVGNAILLKRGAW